ncbi:hypothetical protein 278BB001_14 [Bacillus phage 278BB001]|nr:hypothetical protein 278BB001_14 [Bacillus phage 278BB001]
MKKVPLNTYVYMRNSVSVIVKPKGQEKQLVPSHRFICECLRGDGNAPAITLYDLFMQVIQMFDLNEGDNEAVTIDVWEEGSFHGIIYRYTDFHWYRHSYTAGRIGDIPSMRGAHGNE